MSGPSDTGLNHGFNYVRNSVKATVDAYDGTVKFYVIDPKDPLIRSYRQAFPDLFTDFDKMPNDLKEHLRYPGGPVPGAVGRVLAATTSPRAAASTRAAPSGSSRRTRVPVGSQRRSCRRQHRRRRTRKRGATSTGNRMRPYYLYINQPGEQEPSFIILQPFVPVSAGNKQTRLVSFMTASSDPRNYGELTAFEMPQGESVLGPVQIDNRIKSTPEVSRNLTLLNQQGSTVIQGSLQLIPVGNSILYIRPFYVQAAGELELSAVPFRRRRVRRSRPRPGAPPSTTVWLNCSASHRRSHCPMVARRRPPPAPPAGGNVQDLLDQAAATYQQAQDALRQGDLGTYQELINQVGDLINRAQQAAGGGGGTGGAGATTTTTTPARQTAAGAGAAEP